MGWDMNNYKLVKALLDVDYVTAKQCGPFITDNTPTSIGCNTNAVAVASVVSAERKSGWVNILSFITTNMGYNIDTVIHPIVSECITALDSVLLATLLRHKLVKPNSGDYVTKAIITHSDLCLELLLKYGFKAGTPSSYHAHSVLRAAIIDNNHRVVTLLVDNGAPIGIEEVSLAKELGNYEIASELATVC